MRDLKAWQKRGLIGAISMVPFAVVTYKMVSSIDMLGVEFARQELRGLDYYAPLSALLKDLQLHGSLMALTFSGDDSSEELLDKARAAVDSDIKRVDEA